MNAKNIIKLTAILAVASSALLGCGQNHIQTRIVENGWYERADSKASGFLVDSSPANRRLGETGLRCLGEGKFIVEDLPGDKFKVVDAPQGYKDTIGRKFKSKKLSEFGNYMD